MDGDAGCLCAEASAVAARLSALPPAAAPAAGGACRQPFEDAPAAAPGRDEEPLRLVRALAERARAAPDAGRGASTASALLAVCEALVPSLPAHEGALCEAVTLLGRLAAAEGPGAACPRRSELRRLLALTEARSARVWLAVLGALRAMTGAGNEPAGCPWPPPPPPHVSLPAAGGASLGLPFAGAQAAQELRRLAFSGGVTLAAWIRLRAGGGRGRGGPGGVLWRCWEPAGGGWEVRLRWDGPGRGDGGEPCVWCARLRADSGPGEDEEEEEEQGASGLAPEPAEEGEPAFLGHVGAGEWFALTVEVATLEQPGAVRLGGGAGRWAKVNLGPGPGRSRFPPPASPARAVAGTRSAGQDGASRCILLLDGLEVDVAAAFVFRGVRGGDAAAWLRSSMELVEFQNGFADFLWGGGGGGLPGLGECGHDAGSAGDLLGRAVLAYAPGYGHDLMNCSLLDGGSWGRGGHASEAVRLAAGEAPRSAGAPLVPHLSSPMWLASVLWALARLLPERRQRRRRGAAVQPALMSAVLCQTFDFVARAILWKGLRARGAAQRMGRHFFAEDRGFAVWSYVLWRCVDPAWLDLAAACTLCELVAGAAADPELSQDCWAQLAGPHMAEWWASTLAPVQRRLWDTLYFHCRRAPARLAILGGPAWLLFDLAEHSCPVDTFCVKLLLLLEGGGAAELRHLWPRMARCLLLPAPHARALLLAVRCLALPGGDGPPAVAALAAAEDGAADVDGAEVAEAICALAGHPDETVRVEALSALRQLDAAGVRARRRELDSLAARLVGRDAPATALTVSAIWAWLRRRAPPAVAWSSAEPLATKVRRLTAEPGPVADDAERPAEVAAGPAPGCWYGSGPLLCAAILALEEADDGALWLRFLTDFRLLLGCAGADTGCWWDELKLCHHVWHPRLLNFLARICHHDAAFSAAAKLHTTVASGALALDPEAWRLLQGAVCWASSGGEERALVCRALLAQLFEAVGGSFGVQLRDAASSADHPLASNLARLTTVLHDFLLPPAAAASPCAEGDGEQEAAGDTPAPPGLPETLAPPLAKGGVGHLHPSTLRLATGAGGAAQSPSGQGRGKPVVWIDYAVADRFLQLWAALLLRDPLQGQSLAEFDLDRWSAGRQRPFPLDGAAERLLLAPAGQEPTFAHLLHWGTRCLLYQAPLEADLRDWHRAHAASDEADGGDAGGDVCSGALAAVAPAGGVQALEARRRTLCVLRHLVVSLLAIGAHSGSARAQAAQESIGIAAVCFCVHAANCAEAKPARAAGAGAPEAQEAHAAAKGLVGEAREHAADVLALLLLLCLQKEGHYPVGSTLGAEDELRACSEGGRFPCTVLRHLPGLLLDKAARDLEGQFARPPEPSHWSSPNSWMDPFGVQSSLQALWRPRLEQAAAAAAEAARGGARRPCRSEVPEIWLRYQMLEQWNFHEAAAGSPLASATCGFFEAVRDPTWGRGAGLRIPLEASPAASALADGHAEGGLEGATPAPCRLEQLGLAADEACRRLRDQGRCATVAAWRAVCRANAAPGGFWQPASEWDHVPPPKPPRRVGGPDRYRLVQEGDPEFGGARTGEEDTGAAGADAGGGQASHRLAEALAAPAVAAVEAAKACLVRPEASHRLAEALAAPAVAAAPRGRLGGEGRGAWWRRSFLRSTAATATCKAGRGWAVSRTEGASGWRPLLHETASAWGQDELGGRAGSRASSSSSATSRSDESDAPAPDEEPPVLTAECTWIRREGSLPCTLRLCPTALWLHPRDALDQRPGGGAALATRRYARGRRRAWRFRLGALRASCGVLPRRFLHRQTGLELRFADGGAPVCLHFDRESPPDAGGAAANGSAGGAHGGGAGEEAPQDAAAGLGGGLGGAGAAAAALLGRVFGEQQDGAEVSRRDEAWCYIERLRRRLEAASAASEEAPGLASPPVGAAVPRRFGRGGAAEAAARAAAAAAGPVTPELRRPPRSAEAQRLRQQHAEGMDRYRERVTKEWQSGEISNLCYLNHLNLFSGRSLEDLSQYPVAPWILQDLQSAEPPSAVLERDDPEEILAYFRDLSKTLGDLGSRSRREELAKRYHLVSEVGESVPYHYGSHYSAPAYVMHFLVRAQPFSDLARDLQGGRFDVADRIFCSLPETWRSCLAEMSDVRELVPELFTLPEALLNLSGLDLGVRQDLSRVGHVELPAWARDAYHFVHEHQAALESAPVSRTLHGWIDLIWGCKQTGLAARDALNVFYPLTYEGGVDWDQVEPATRHSKEQQVLHFGQTPRQLFQQPHPAREVAPAPTLLDPQGHGGGRHPGAAVALWHSSAAPAQPQPLGVQPLVRARGLQLQAPVVAIGAAPAAPGQGGASRLQVVRADGYMSFYRVRLRQGGEGGTGGSWPGLQVDPEAAFYLPSVGGGLQGLFLSSWDSPAQASASWALLPEARFFARGGLRDGSILFGGTSEAEAQLLSRAHAAPVSALAASSECASQVPDAYGLLLLAGSLDGEVCLWAASDWEWRSFACTARWQPHLAAVRGVDFGERLGLALSCGDDGLVHVYRLRPPTRLLRAYRFQGGLPATEARFAAGAPAAVVACSAEAARICVWALAGFLLASLDLAEVGPVRRLRVVPEGDGSREGLLVALGAEGAGQVELWTLPYLRPAWRLGCQWGMPPCALDCRPGARGAVWLGHEDGTFGAAVAAGGPRAPGQPWG